MEHYVDNSATTRVCPEAAEAALDAMLNTYGNPSSTYTKGREAKKLLDRCSFRFRGNIPGILPDGQEWRGQGFEKGIS